MKTYFVEYLRSEGEFEGGMGISLDGSIQYCHISEHHGVDWYIDEGVKPIKLFLCSRNIQAGDKFTHKTNAAKTEQICLTVDAINNIIQDREHNFYMLSFCHKVIGEISQEATWVKEGDEFDEYKEEITLFKGGSKKLIQVKGPCGHFH